MFADQASVSWCLSHRNCLPERWCTSNTSWFYIKFPIKNKSFGGSRYQPQRHHFAQVLPLRSAAGPACHLPSGKHGRHQRGVAGLIRPSNPKTSFWSVVEHAQPPEGWAFCNLQRTHGPGIPGKEIVSWCFLFRVTVQKRRGRSHPKSPQVIPNPNGLIKLVSSHGCRCQGLYFMYNICVGLLGCTEKKTDIFSTKFTFVCLLSRQRHEDLNSDHWWSLHNHWLMIAGVN